MKEDLVAHGWHLPAAEGKIVIPGNQVHQFTRPVLAGADRGEANFM